jgi:hypothetical protein
MSGKKSKLKRLLWKKITKHVENIVKYTEF